MFAFCRVSKFSNIFGVERKDNLSITRTPVYTGPQCPQNTYNDVVEQKNHLTDIKTIQKCF